MATVQVVGYARTTSGSQIPLSTAAVEGTETTITTDSVITTTAQDLGTYMPGTTVVALELSAVNGISYAYILRQGVILAWGSVNVNGVNNKEMMLCTPVVLRPGDQVRCLALAAASKNVALCTYTNQGTSRIFIGTVSGSSATTTTALNDLQDTNNSIGDTLQGQVIVKAMVTGITPKVLSSMGVWIRNASGQVAGIVPMSNPIKVEPMISNVAIPISLNWTASVYSDES